MTRIGPIDRKLLCDNVPGLGHKHLEEDNEKRFNDEATRRGGINAPKYQQHLPRHFIGTFDPGQRDRVLKALAEDQDVEYFEPDRLRLATPTWGTVTPNDPSLDLLWGMNRIGASNAWTRQSAVRAPSRVAVIEVSESGTSNGRFDNQHRDLAAQNSPVQNDSRPVSGHATHVAGIIAATGNNGLDVTGVANVELVSLTPGAAGPSVSGFANAIGWARNNQVRVINMSFKWCGNDLLPNPCDRCIYPAPSQTEQDAIRGALNAIVFVAAAANDRCQTDAAGRSPIPASYAGVIAVSAIDQNDALADFSNHGPYIALTAPGVNITSTRPGDVLGTSSGTSFAAPHVAGAAAAVLAVRNNYDVPSIPRLLQLTAQDIGDPGRDNQFGEGVVRADSAVAAVADVYGDLFPNFFLLRGTLELPFFAAQAINNVAPGGTVGLVRTPGSSYTGFTTLSKPCTIIAVGGPVTIGN